MYKYYKNVTRKTIYRYSNLDGFEFFLVVSGVNWFWVESTLSKVNPDFVRISYKEANKLTGNKANEISLSNRVLKAEGHLNKLITNRN
jgi:hypothetical protein